MRPGSHAGLRRRDAQERGGRGGGAGAGPARRGIGRARARRRREPRGEAQGFQKTQKVHRANGVARQRLRG